MNKTAKQIIEGAVARGDNTFLNEAMDGVTLSDDGFVLDKGKFSGEPAWVPYFYEVEMNGFYGEKFGNCTVFAVEENDRQLFPTFFTEKDIYAAIVHTEIGFVVGMTGDDLPIEYGGKWEIKDEDEDEEEEDNNEGE